uniref:Ankyrin and armadillo repeat containing n=1 Tax=Sinocyclocheilus rhinocerous TaxID=307959 RepID=A0A673JB70_9TELE
LIKVIGCLSLNLYCILLVCICGSNLCNFPSVIYVFKNNCFLTCNQTAVAHAGGVPHLVEFLSVNSEVLQEEACLALAELAWGHRENQRLICEAGAVGALVQALRERKIPVKVKAATVLESIASHNPAIQQCFLRQSTAKYLLQLLKVMCFQLEVREQGATALWALAGQTLKQQKLMAEQMGYPVILDLLLSSSDKMQYVGKARYKLDGFCREILPFVCLLRGSQTALKTLLSVIKALGCLCIGVALTTNKNTQKIICREKAISYIIRVQVAQTLACVLLGNQKLQREFWEQEDFSYDIILELMGAENKSICLDAGHALSLFAYNNKVQQKAIRQTGRILMNTYETFLSSDIETESAKAAFQIVALARVISRSDEVTLTARGVTVLTELLQSDQSTTVVITAQLFASLVHTRAGITNAIVTMGAVEHLSVRKACASALDARISQLFTAEFERQRRIGFPSLSLEINGSPPVPHRDNKGLAKRMNTRCSQSAIGDRETPALLPHHARQRARTANPRVRKGQTSCHNAPKQRLNENT